jgi:hypothetical protein
MSDVTEQDFIANGKLDHLYTHHFQNGAGKYFNIITTEEGNTTFEYEEPGIRRNRLKLTLTFIRDKNDITAVTLKRFKFYKNEGWQEQFWGPHDPFTLPHFSFEKLATFLKLLSDLDLASVNERRIALVEGKGLGIDADTERKVKALLIQPDGQRIIEELVSSGIITSRDIVNIGYRKHQLRVFERLLRETGYAAAYANENGIRTDQPEKAWQHFFKRNHWIFGFGLDYRFLGILQDEAHLGVEDVAGRDSAVGDFLMGASHFTVLVEVKRPDTPMFGISKNRANSWQLSRDLIDAVSQILEQKASWQIKSEVNAGRNYDTSDKLIQQKTIDPKCIMIFGCNELYRDQRERDLKLRTFELFRRDSRNIEIVTYDELFERATFIVRHGESSA